MNIWPSRRPNAVPRDWTVHAEIMKAVRTLAAQEEDEYLRRRQAELVSFRRDCESLAAVVREACRECASIVSTELRKAGYNPNEPRVPAGNPDGGEWTREAASAGSSVSGPVLSDATPDHHWIPGAQYAANDTPGSGHNQGPPLEAPPEIPEEEPPTAKFRNAFLRAAARWLLKAGLQATLGAVAADYLLALQAVDWLRTYLPYIIAYCQPPKTWAELQQDALNPQPGYDIHHPVEQSSALEDGFPLDVVDGPGNRLRISTFRHWQITAWYATKNEDFDGLSPRDYLRGRSWDERVRVAKDAMIEFGVLAP